jgi:hypothetical protein
MSLASTSDFWKKLVSANKQQTYSGPVASEKVSGSTPVREGLSFEAASGSGCPKETSWPVYQKEVIVSTGHASEAETPTGHTCGTFPTRTMSPVIEVT